MVLGDAADFSDLAAVSRNQPYPQDLLNRCREICFIWMDYEPV
jgi:hypothetical protein